MNLKSDNVRKIMQARLDVAKEKGCDGVDPDNVDGYDNENGLDLTVNRSILDGAFQHNLPRSSNFWRPYFATLVRRV